MALEHFGILLGFLGALFQSFNYAFAKDCAEKYALKGLRQLIVVHIGLGLMVVIPFFALNLIEHISTQLIFDTLWSSVPYLVAQYLMIVTLTMTDSSVVSPLLTLKIPVLALIAVSLLDQSFNLNQIIAIFMIIALGFIFSSISGRIKLLPLFLVTVVGFMYAVSDLGMAAFMDHYPGDRLSSIIALICYQFMFCGIIALPFLWIKSYNLSFAHVKYSGKIAVTWMISDIFFVTSFNLAGVVQTSIVQSLRSVLGVVIAYLFYSQYIKDHNTFKKKMAIAVFMFIAVTLYYM